MLQKMYSERLSEVRDFRSVGGESNGVGKKKLDFRFYWSSLLKNKWLILLFTALMTALAVAYCLMAVPVYAAKATLLLESQKANIISIEDLVSTEQESLDYYGTQYAILKSRALSERVIQTLGSGDQVAQEKLAAMLGASSSDVFKAMPTDDAAGMPDRSVRAEYNEIINRFRESLKISPVVKTKLVTISYESTDPEFSPRSFGKPF
jgi:uncharacterized protein involved in exopolysaccharide biosynthesis